MLLGDVYSFLITFTKVFGSLISAICRKSQNLVHARRRDTDILISYLKSVAQVYLRSPIFISCINKMKNVCRQVLLDEFGDLPAGFNGWRLE